MGEGVVSNIKGWFGWGIALLDPDFDTLGLDGVTRIAQVDAVYSRQTYDRVSQPRHTLRREQAEARENRAECLRRARRMRDYHGRLLDNYNRQQAERKAGTFGEIEHYYEQFADLRGTKRARRNGPGRRSWTCTRGAINL